MFSRVLSQSWRLATVACLAATCFPLFGEPPTSAPVTTPTEAKEESSGPWRLADALKLPEWLTVSGTHRVRFEYVFNQFRSGRPGDSRLLVFRTTALVEARHEQFRFGAELLDSRAYHETNDTPINTTSVNPVELLQAYASFHWEDEQRGLTGRVKGGRLTYDFGSRRLVARNRYRNTINSFTGVEAEIVNDCGWSTRATFSLPIQRRPLDADDLDDNDPEFDREDEEVYFYGIFVKSPELGPGILTEYYFFALNEEDTSDRATRDRELYNPGFRVYRKPGKNVVDFEVEGVLQFGHSRSSAAATNTTRLLHLAYFVHGAVGYTFDAPWKPRVILQYDFASGDRDPNDSRNERFDTLFGARRFEFGPTGIYGAFARSNLHTPGIRIQVKPRSDMSAFLAYRPFWLAEQRDAWTTSGLRDVTGDSGTFLGHQLDGRFRWDLVPGNVRFECGAAGLLRGGFVRDAPGANPGDPLVVYAQTAFTF